VGEDDGAGGEGGPEHLLDELRARGREEQELGERPDGHLVAEEQRAHALGQRRPPRLADEEDGAVRPPEVRLQQPRLGALPAAVYAFEGDEQGLSCVRVKGSRRLKPPRAPPDTPRGNNRRAVRYRATRAPPAAR